MDLLLPFDTDDVGFARGFELGRLWAQLQADPDAEVVELVHAENAEMLIRMGEATGRPFEAEVLDDIWLEVRFAAADELAFFGAEGAE